MEMMTLHIGMGRGTAKLEFDAFQLDMTETRDRFRETWDIFKKATEGKPFTYQGQHLSVHTEIRLRPQLGNRKPDCFLRRTPFNIRIKDHYGKCSRRKGA